MRTLYEGIVGTDVSAWQAFLRGWNPLTELVVDGIYDSATATATRAYQQARNLAQHGVAGPRTQSAAMSQDGFNPLNSTGIDRMSKAWPPPPGFGPMQAVDRARILGAPSFTPLPTSVNPEGVKLEQAWVQRNITTVDVPELDRHGILGAPKGGRVHCHRLAAPRLLELFACWSANGLADRVLAWGGMWTPRFIRGSRTTLSNHALGAAFDLNAPWNALGTTGALLGERGCVRELVESAAELGWYWGGWWGQPGSGSHSTRPDPMHFELARV